jgi:hypothetical protein
MLTESVTTDVINIAPRTQQTISDKASSQDSLLASTAHRNASPIDKHIQQLYMDSLNEDHLLMTEQSWLPWL